MPLADSDDARALFRVFGGWFGPPVVMFRGQMIDGRKRARPYEAIYTVKPPQVVAPNQRAAAQLLAAAEHYERALEHIPRSIAFETIELESYLQLDRSRIAPLIALVRHTGRRRPSRRQRRRDDVVAALRDLYVASLEGHAVTPEDLKGILGEWL